MSKLSFMEKLLDGAEVEWNTLGDAVNLQRGKRLVKSQLEESGKCAVYQNSMTPLGFYHEGNFIDAKRSDCWTERTGLNCTTCTGVNCTTDSAL